MKTPFYTVLFLILSLSAFAQKERSPNFIGINPSVTAEPTYEKGEKDINLLPFVYQKSISKRLDLRFNTILNLGIRNDGNEISHIGLETAMPVFIKKKETKSEISQRVYIAPVVCYTRNRIEEHHTLGLWIEPGYHVLFKKNWALSFAPQIGATYFNYDHDKDTWGSHFGIKIIFGKWL